MVQEKDWWKKISSNVFIHLSTVKEAEKGERNACYTCTEPLTNLQEATSNTLSSTRGCAAVRIWKVAWVSDGEGYAVKKTKSFCFVTCLICDIWWPPHTKVDACQKPDFWHTHSTNQTVLSLALSSLHTGTIKWYLCGIHYRNKARGAVDSWKKECRFGFQNGGNIFFLHILHHGAVLILECLISLLYHEILVLFLITAAEVFMCNWLVQQILDSLICLF